MGPFHLRYPSYNAVSIVDYLKALKPDAVAITSLAAHELNNPQWQNTQEISLPLSVMPYLKKETLSTHFIHEPSPDPSAQEDFFRFASEYPQLGQKLSQAQANLRPLNELLGKTLSLKRITEQVLPLLSNYQDQKEELLEDGPATDWLHARATTMAKRLLDLSEERVVLLANIDHIPFMQRELEGKVDWITPPEIDISEASRERSIMDFAFRGDVPEPGNLINKLRDIKNYEARYHEANLFLMNAHVAEALQVLEETSTKDFNEPYYLPGYLLSRLGQIYDLVNNRKAALRSYKGVLALEFAPQEAIEAAKEGLEKAFGQENPT